MCFFSCFSIYNEFSAKKSPYVLCLNISLKKHAVIELSKCRTEVRFCYCIYPYLFLNVFKIIEKFPENSRQHTEPILDSKSLVILKKKPYIPPLSVKSYTSGSVFECSSGTPLPPDHSVGKYIS